MPSNMLFLALLLFSFSCQTSLGQAGLTFFEQDCLDSHNNFRSLHSGLQPMTWNEDIAQGARNWSQFLLQNQTLLRDDAVLNSQNLGENLWRVFSSPAQPICNNASETSCVNCSQVVTEWYNEISNYNFDTGTAINSSLPWLHFTQLVWRSSTELGVGVASGGGRHYVVARYKPRGNVVGRFSRNVPRLKPTEPPPTTTVAPATTTAPATTGPATTIAPATTTAPATTAPATTTAPTSTAIPAGLTFFEQDCLDSHNNFRSLHSAFQPMAWNRDIANGAKTWAKFLLQNQSLLHEVAVLNSQNLGENLWRVFSSPAQPICSNASETSCVNCSQVVAEWYNEISNYNFGNQTAINSSLPWLHFTQVVWRSSTELGVGVASGGGRHYVVARYKPRGNVDGRFDRNVARLLPPTIDGNFTEWGPWGPCSASCSGGTQIRLRNCTNPPPSNNGLDCQGPRNETQQCNVQPCPVDGNFTEWGPWGSCSAPCAGGTQIRFRNCTNPPPINNGLDCQGPRNETQQCNVQPCPAGLSFFEQDCLDSHNNFRSLHSAFQPMAWNRDIANGARTWAQFLLQNQSLLHEVAVLNSQNLGENLWRVFTSPAQPICSNASETSCVNCSQVVTEWYNEISNYNFGNQTAINSSLPWLHFTQVVWRSSTELGVGVASGGGRHYVVARYKPRGNVDGRFDRNVARLLPPTSL
ncbi:hypothetical protein ACROYT_G040196 [Oculina patagonica]